MMKKNGRNKLFKKSKSLEDRIRGFENLPDDKNTQAFPLFSDETFRTLFQLSPNAIFITNFEDGKILEANDVFCQVPGYTREEVIGKTTLELGLWIGEDRAKIIERLLTAGTYQNMEMQHRKKDGTIFTSLDSGKMVTIGDKRYIIVIGIDITGRKEVEEALRLERDLNDSIINSLPGFFYIVNEEQKLLRWNNNVASVTGYSAEELQRMNIEEQVVAPYRSSIPEKIQQGIRLGEITSEVDIVLKDGTVKTFLFNSKRIKYKGKNCLVGTGTDISDQKRTEEDLKRFAENLEDANIALRVLMNRKNADQKDFEAKLQINVNELVIPYVQKLKLADLDDRNKKYLSMLENNLRDVLSPFMRDFRSANRNLTPQEIQIIDLIMKGKNTKEISVLLNASVNTIAAHRKNIRKKLNLRNQKTRLRSYILSRQ